MATGLVRRVQPKGGMVVSTSHTLKVLADEGDQWAQNLIEYCNDELRVFLCGARVKDGEVLSYIVAD